MRKPSPIFTPLGFSIAAIFLAVLGFRFWQEGAQLFSPGDLSAKALGTVEIGGFSSHAEFEVQCELCHQPFVSSLAEKCLECHIDIDAQTQQGMGIHSKFENFNTCHNCHSEHQGRNFNPTDGARKIFDHSLAAFSLLHHQIDFDASVMGCNACHDPESFAVSAEACLACHGRQNQTFMSEHQRDFGSACLDCHDGQDTLARFDHAQTSFPLDGKHSIIKCTACHVTGRLESIAMDCSHCHEEPPIHAGSFGQDCKICHITEAWYPAKFEGELFDHKLSANFDLALHQQDYQGVTITCQDCHIDGFEQFDLISCIDCHSQENDETMALHRSQVGDNCIACHDGGDRMIGFDHANVFVLEGKHSEIACTDCHSDYQFSGISNECSQCHTEPEIHAGVFGLNCQNCHTSVAWRPAQLAYHSFPVDHGNPEQVNCLVCHTQRYTEYTCYGCHEHEQREIEREHIDEGVNLEELANCAHCHPAGREEDDD